MTKDSYNDTSKQTYRAFRRDYQCSALVGILFGLHRRTEECQSRSYFIGIRVDNFRGLFFERQFLKMLEKGSIRRNV